MKLEKADCYIGSLFPGMMVVFVPSGYKGVWVKVTADDAYNVAVKYASDQECKMLMEEIKNAK